MNFNKFLVLILGMCLFSVNAMADEGNNPQPPPFADSPAEAKFIEGLKGKGVFALDVEMRGLAVSAAGVCAVGGVLVGADAIVESIPIVGGLGAAFADLINEH